MYYYIFSHIVETISWYHLVNTIKVNRLSEVSHSMDHWRNLRCGAPEAKEAHWAGWPAPSLKKQPWVVAACWCMLQLPNHSRNPHPWYFPPFLSWESTYVCPQFSPFWLSDLPWWDSHRRSMRRSSMTLPFTRCSGSRCRTLRARVADHTMAPKLLMFYNRVTNLIHTFYILYIYTHIHIYIFIILILLLCIYLIVYIYIYECVCARICDFIICRYVWIYIYMNTWIHIYLYIILYIRIYVYICMHRWTHN